MELGITQGPTNQRERQSEGGGERVVQDEHWVEIGIKKWWSSDKKKKQ